MALSSISSNNKLVQFRKDINREYCQENMFAPYTGSSMGSIFRRIYDPKKGGEQVNVPMVNRLTGTAKSTGTLTDNEEAIDNYGMRVWVDWARHAVATNDAEEQKDSADIFGEAKPLLSDWGKELIRDETIAALMALPSESAPSGLGSSSGQRVNGILYQSASTANKNAWGPDNADRVLYGEDKGNYSATHATALGNITTSTGKLDRGIVSLQRRMAVNANPNIRPYKTKDGYEYFVMFVGAYQFRDLKADMDSVHQNAMPRGKDNIIFQAGDLYYDGVIIREVPQIDYFVDNVWTSLTTAGDGGSRVAPSFLCGADAVSHAWAKMATPTTRDETDYQFIKGAGVKMCYGIAKNFYKDSSDNLVQRGVLTGFQSAAVDS